MRRTLLTAVWLAVGGWASGARAHAPESTTGVGIVGPDAYDLELRVSAHTLAADAPDSDAAIAYLRAQLDAPAPARAAFLDGLRRFFGEALTLAADERPLHPQVGLPDLEVGLDEELPATVYDDFVVELSGALPADARNFAFKPSAALGRVELRLRVRGAETASLLRAEPGLWSAPLVLETPGPPIAAVVVAAAASVVVSAVGVGIAVRRRRRARGR